MVQPIETNFMHTWIVFLRGVNVSGNRKLKMADLKKVLEQAGFQQVKTHIQSGNLVVLTHLEATETAKKITSLIRKHFDFGVPTAALDHSGITKILEEAPFKDAEHKNRYFSILMENPSNEALNAFNKLVFAEEDFLVKNGCVYLNCKKGAGKAKLGNTLIENKLKVSATTRNLNTMLKMVDLAKEMEATL